MKKSASQKHQIVQRLKDLIRSSRKMARQLNRKLESLATINKMKEAAKADLIKICGSK